MIYNCCGPQTVDANITEKERTMRILRVIGLVMFVAASITAQNPFRDGEFATTRDANFSPDGKYIVFASFVEQPKPDNSKAGGKRIDDVSGVIRVMNADGTGMRDVTPKKFGIYDSKPSVSYDNSKITFLRQTGLGVKKTVDVYVVNFDGTGVKRVTHTGDKVEAFPVFTADGKEIVYIKLESMSLVDRQEIGELIAYNVSTTIEKVVLGKEYRVAQAIPTVKPGGFFIIGADLDAAGKPIPPTRDGSFGNLLGIASPELAATRNLPPVRPYSAFKLPANEDPFVQSISMAKDRGTIVVTVRYGTDYYLVTRTGTESLGNLEEAVMNISADGTKLIHGSRQDHVKVYDIASKKWTKLVGKP